MNEIKTNNGHMNSAIQFLATTPETGEVCPQSHDGPGVGSQVSGCIADGAAALSLIKLKLSCKKTVLFILCGFNELLLLLRRSPVIENRDSTGTDEALVPR